MFLTTKSQVRMTYSTDFGAENPFRNLKSGADLGEVRQAQLCANNGYKDLHKRCRLCLIGA